ncbi:MAG: AbrB/MazE/SpoVT family DNA-binding domain-containing protein [Methanosarcinales archaeon]|nr:AbrB/MazE/SpoVT family DNA-binding domain-containing protein [Methanosarcinales archaeon]
MVSFSFGRRKIVGMNYTRYVSIPKDWLRFKGLDAGDDVEFILGENDNLVLKKAEVQKSEGENNDL